MKQRPAFRTLAAALLLLPLPASADFSFSSFPADGGGLVLAGLTGIVDGAARLTDMTPKSYGELWHPEKQPVASGFDTTFTFKLHRPDDDFFYGTDGITLILHNDPAGTDTVPQWDANGVSANSLNIKFDSWYTTPADGSSSSVQVRAGITILATVDLSAVEGVVLDTPPVEGPPGGGPPWGFPVPTLTSRSSSPSHTARVVYHEGLLDIYFQGIQVVSGLAVDLSAIGAVDEEGNAYLGFSGTTAAHTNVRGTNNRDRVFADQSQFTDLFAWSFTSGAAAGNAPLALLSHSFDFASFTLALEWSSTPGKTYRVVSSPDLETWTPIETFTAIPASSGPTTTAAIPFLPAEPKAFFRIEEN